MNKLKQVLKSKKGFTLMEVIIVVIILAVLAAALIPTFIGFVQRAGHSQAIAEARLGMTAAQSVVTEVVGRTGSAPTQATLPAAISRDETFRRIILADAIPGIANDGDVENAFPSIYVEGNRVTGLTYAQQGPNASFWVRIPRDGGAVEVGNLPVPPDPSPSPVGP